jgi:hypothetical protein
MFFEHVLNIVMDLNNVMITLNEMSKLVYGAHLQNLTKRLDLLPLVGHPCM